MAIGSIDDFKAKLAGGGSRSNLFRVRLNNPAGVAAGLNLELAAFMCEGAQLPESTVGLIEIPFRGRRFKIAGERAFAEWTVTVINDTEFVTRNALERWMNAIANHADAGGAQDPRVYFTDLHIDQLGRDNQILKTYTFKDAWPQNISAIDLSYAAEDIERFSVTWQYQYWTSNTTDGVFNPVSGLVQTG